MKRFTPFVLKKILLSVLSVLLFISVDSRDIIVNENAGTGIDIKLNTYEELQFSTTFDVIRAYKVNTEAGIFTELVIPGYPSSYALGEPKLPVSRKLIEYPVGASAVISIVSYDAEEYDLAELGFVFPVMPAQAPAPKDGSQLPFEYKAAAYAINSFTSTPLVSLQDLGMMRGIRIARVDIAPVQYNPVSGKLRVYSNIEAKIVFQGADVMATLEEKKKNEAPYFRSVGAGLINYKSEQSANRDTISKYPIKYVIVSDPMFETQLEPFVEWKTKKGFTVIEAYTDDPAVGSTTSSIKAYLEGLYNAGTTDDPAPSFVLFVGDVAQIPAWDGNAGWHVTDLYYVEYTNDYFPEIYYGRWSATNSGELQPIIDKTLQYEQYTMPDPSYLNEVVLVAGMDGNFAQNWGNGQINYGTENYFNAAHGLTSHTYLYPASGSNASNIRQNISDGVSFGNYTAHCSNNGWADPSFSISDVANLQNVDEYCVLIGNCCLSSQFDIYCFAEAITRAEDKGAVAYLGATNSSYWDEDYYFGVGVGAITEDPPSYEETSLGNYDRSFHDHGEAWEDWYTTTYQIIFAGNLAVTEGSPGSAEYYWEMYCVMGDPSLECYFGVPDPMSVSYDPLMPLGVTSFTVAAEPYAYVGISKDGVLHGAALADASGIAVVTMDPIMVPGTADIVVTKQNAEPFIGTVIVNNPAGPYVMLSDYTVNDPSGNNNSLPDYGESVSLDVELENLGGADANNVEGTLTSIDEYITITDASASWGTIAAGGSSTQTDAFAFDIDAIIPDQHHAVFELEVTGSGKDTWVSAMNITLNAPVLETGVIIIDDSQGGNGNGRLDPGETAELILPIMNNGHCDAANAIATLSSTSGDIVINNGSVNAGSIAVGNSVNVEFGVTVSEEINPGTSIPFEFLADAEGYIAELNFFMVAGQIPVLVIDLDPNNSSASEMATCLANLSVGSEMQTSIPDDLQVYSSVFVCLGIYADNHALTNAEGQALAEYLDGGGNLYMEGGDTWYYDAQTPVHPMFGIIGQEDGSNDLGTILGQEGTFTEDMSFTYSGENNWIDRIAPASDAFLIFSNEAPEYGTGVAMIGPTYRTIGCSHEFSGLDDADFTKDYLMFKYLQFFGIDAVWVGLDEVTLNENSISVYPNPVNNSARLHITLLEKSSLSISIFNSTGQEVLKLADNRISEKGEHMFEINTAGMTGGIYHCLISAGDQNISKKIVVIK